MSDNGSTKSMPLITEAPASWNTRYVTPDGFVCQLTLRGESGRDLLEKANAALDWLRVNDFQPSDFNSSRSRSNGNKSEANLQPANGNDNHGANWCPIHNCEMKRWEKNGKVWYSHKVDGEWCIGKSHA